MKVTTLKKKYKNKWVLGEVLKEGKYQEVLEVNPIIISDDRDEVYKALGNIKRGAHVTTMYTGQIPPPDKAYILAVT
ncbi:hypothetical protein HY407_03285 [Candidatus Gottesmanbacteria bacterium]|nr:hypothetical protein [Candidatus Gottesmanbacteria bacterium]